MPDAHMEMSIKKQTYKTLPTIIAAISMQTCYGSNLVPTPCGWVSTLFSLFNSEFMDLDSADICFREEKENWSIKFPKAEKQNQECLWENWKQIAGWTQLPGILELVGPPLTRCYYRNYSKRSLLLAR